MMTNQTKEFLKEWAWLSFAVWFGMFLDHLGVHFGWWK